ncbi:MAG: acetyl-CoA carboxylase biotin carboxyl carrier protein [Thermoguttaceae bacterium]|nr:acetyl-CoA carboxylase biotin carboxyl carrier protein [Thermoguttaceae bacterium]MBQ6616965.1 acetyl-CoA carboxylase biotin carboxyl carrier protein [Thermoguttaceae bacterium]
MEKTNVNIFDAENLEQLLSLMKQYDLNELELHQGDTQLKLKRGGEVVAIPAAPVAAAPAPAPAAAPAAPASAPAEAKDDPAIKTINSPMVGTFYAAANPNAAPYLKVGDTAVIGKTSCIIEAMKVMNQIPIDVAGRVVAVLVENGAPVEFGQALFKIDTRG